MALIVTPINKLPASRSFRQHHEQMDRDANHEPVVWQVSNARIGDMFVFARNGKDVSFREIIDVERNQIYLGPELQVWTWDLWMELGGTHIRRTSRLQKRGILSFLKHKIEMEK